MTTKKIVIFSSIVKVSSTLSIIGSLYIIYHSIRIISRRGTHNTQQRKHRLSAEYNRILIGLSSCDLISSVGFFVSPSAVPFDETKGERSFYNAGNQLTCNIQGAMLQFGLLGGLCYNTCLALYFYLFVRTKIQGEDIADLYQSNSRVIRKDSSNNTKGPDKTNSRKEILLHFGILFYPVFSTIVLVVQGYFNPMAKSLCWIIGSPVNCVGDECIRGENIRFFRLLFADIPTAVCITIICTSILFLHISVKKFDKQTINKLFETLEETSTTKKSTSVEVNNHQTLFSASINADTLNDIDTECDLYQHQDIMKEDESPEIENNNTPENMNSSIKKVCQKIRRLSILYLLALLSVWVMFVIQTVIFPLLEKYPRVALFPLIGPMQGMFNAFIFGNFNVFAFIHRHLLVILFTVFISMTIYFVWTS